MTGAFNEAVATVQARRKALQTTLEDMRGRLSPPQLAEDALSLIDPDLTLLGRFKERIQNNRLLSLAVLAGVGWLVGAPRHHDGEPLEGREAGTKPPRANMKEKKNDSGQIHGEHWSGTGSGRQEEQPPQEPAEEAIVARRSRKAQQDGGIPPVERQPQQRGVEQREVEERQQNEEQPEIGQQRL